MRNRNNGLGRRPFIASAAAAAGLAALQARPAQAAAKYTRYSATSDQGKKALTSYAKAIGIMLKLPPGDPHNWFRNAFVHFMDCPHGNWWFYVWHRGYVGLFEQTIRKISGDASFAFPFWDWSVVPQIPDQMFDGVLTPTDAAYAPYTRDIATFTAALQPTMKKYWDTLSKEQLAQQADRGVTTFEQMWEGVTGGTDPANGAFATTEKARYLTRQNPKLDDATAFDCSRQIVLGGLAPTYFYASDAPPKYLQALSFNSVKTAAHTMQPDGKTWFSIMEGMPHNNVHNYIGGVGPWDPGPYGNMTNFLSPVDPIFFLHHANMDRLWDVWTRKQQALKLDWKPNAKDAPGYYSQPFRFFVNSDGQYITNAKAEDYFSTDVFGYDYAPGTGEELIPATGSVVASAARPKLLSADATMHANTGALTLPAGAGQAHLVAAVTLQRPASGGRRSFDVLVNAPPGTTHVGADSPFFAGRIAFFGPPMQHMHGNGEATFLVPLTDPRQTTPQGGVQALLKSSTSPKLNISVVPSGGSGAAPAIKAVSVQGF